VIQLIQAYVNSPEPAPTRTRHTPRTDPAQAWLERIGRSQPLLGRVRAWWAGKCLHLARAYIAYRENQRWALDFILTEMRHLFQEIGRRLHRLGLLTHPEDIFFLEWQEITQLWQARTPQPAIAELAARRAEFERDAARLPADWIIDGVEYGGGDQLPASTLMLIGTGASAGCIQGQARVVHSPHQLGEVRQGDILIAPNTDPGWTPVFPLLSGLVLETGGMLSHGAIVAREYGIPAVTGINGACQIIATGEPLEVDGIQGIVRRLKAPAPEEV
jgi:pyruvate,water dikinase